MKKSPHNRKIVVASCATVLVAILLVALKFAYRSIDSVSDRQAEKICAQWMESLTLPHMSFQCKSIVREMGRISVTMESRNPFFRGLDIDECMYHLFVLDSSTGEILDKSIEWTDAFVHRYPTLPPIESLLCEGWEFGLQYRVEAKAAGIPDHGNAPLHDILGWRESIHVYRSVSEFILDFTAPVYYVRDNRATVIKFPRGWEIEIDNSTGRILPPKGMPYRTDDELAELTRNHLVGSVWLETVGEMHGRIAATGGGEADGIESMTPCEIKRVSDKLVVVYDIIYDSSAENGKPSAIVFWVDGWTGEVFHEGYLRTWPPKGIVYDYIGKQGAVSTGMP